MNVVIFIIIIMQEFAGHNVNYSGLLCKSTTSYNAGVFEHSLSKSYGRLVYNLTPSYYAGVFEHSVCKAYGGLVYNLTLSYYAGVFEHSLLKHMWVSV